MSTILCMMYEGDNVYEVYQPDEGTFFHTLENTKIDQEYVMMEIEGRVGISKVYILRDIDEEHLFSYTEYLLGNVDFEWNEEVEEFFDLMGHNNVYRFPNDFWKVKLVHERICKLGSKKLFILYEEELPEGNRNIRTTVDTLLERDIDELYSKQVASTGILRYNSKLYTTYLGHYSITNRRNWYEPDKHSKEYIKTLVDEHNEYEFKIMLPNMEDITIDMDIVHSIFDDVLSKYHSLYSYNVYMENNILHIIGNEYLTGLVDKIGRLITPDVLCDIINRGDKKILRDILYSDGPIQIVIRWLVDYPIRYHNIGRYDGYPTDLTTNLLLQSLFGFSFMSYSNIQDDEFRGWNTSSIVEK